MKQYYLLLISCMLIGNLGFAQCTSCCGFSTQKEIDEFPVKYPDCTTVAVLVIQGSDITNLDGLSQITSVVGQVQISSDPDPIDGSYKLTSISGLNNLISIGSSLEIYNVPSLNATNLFPNLKSIGAFLSFEYKLPSTIGGFNNLISIGENFSVQSSKLLENFNGFSNLTSIQGVFSFNSCDDLKTISGFNNLSEIGKGLYITYNPNITHLPDFQKLTLIKEGGVSILLNNSLTDISALNHLETVGGDFSLGLNAFTTLLGLNNLMSINGNLSIYGNAALTDLTALSNLKTLNGILQISQNPVLTSLFGLENITTPLVGLQISNNPVLSTCAITPVCNIIALGGSIIIYDNGVNCKTIQEVATICNLLSATDFIRNDDIMIYPNPTNSILNIKTNNNTILDKIIITNLTGKIILKQTEKTNQVNVQNLAKGMYILQAYSEKEMFQSKFIKE